MSLPRPSPRGSPGLKAAFFRRATVVLAFAGLLSISFGPSGVTPRAHAATTSLSQFCARVIHDRNHPPAVSNPIAVSSGAMSICFGAQPSSTTPNTGSTNPSIGTNVDAGNPREDITPNGTQAYGQSEVSTASVGPYVVEEWNDATGFFAPCPSPMFKEELSGYGFSADGGTTFRDLGGLPNDCTTGFKLEGDPSAESWMPGGKAYFYFSSLYVNVYTGQSDLALNACHAVGAGTSSPALYCGMPTIIATGGPGDFLDKDFLSIDPARGRLYLSYTRFGGFPPPPTPPPPSINGQIELAVCDIGTPTAGTGSAGGTPGHPVCFPGGSPTPYLIVGPPDPNCENEGAYPAVDVKTGDVYVSWEFNWATNFENPACFNAHVQNKTAYVPFACLTLTPTSPCVTTPLTTAVNIDSMAAAFIPGYNRFPANDFPRIAVSDPHGTVSITWNDTRYHAMGDILLQSYNLVSLSPVQSNPVRINSLSNDGMHFLPALRNTDDAGDLYVSFYQRSTANTTLTDYVSADDFNPRTTSTPGSNMTITTGPTDWNAVSSDIVPNFGDYTDNYVRATQSSPYTDDTVYFAWSDGRLGLPQPFNDHRSD